MPTTPLQSGGCTLTDAGHDWDAIRVPRSVGLSAVDLLGSRCGAVLYDGRAVVYLLVPTGTTTWSDDTTRALGSGSSLVMPPPRRTAGPGPYWRICPGDGGLLTDPGALAAALVDVSRASAGRPT
ncbi:hypothetical protein [Streptomyces daghestanicus]|jgi:hypothetical protein|uniref:Uncharacterized protein n=1 Tax=Streptomyces daghestanicus TaxID=66885 RepID=A0ABQ3Q7M9_9ACTN|nr:hypothetical protein [Streptomyces daghestanicus]GGU69054.1 hypothetical protein GCM10010259_68630 [Streptomyces daghestanicus]GHI33257.1 hypothetical protein Sdagh_49870 [Streptomyces daghestanicus]